MATEEWVELDEDIWDYDYSDSFIWLPISGGNVVGRWIASGESFRYVANSLDYYRFVANKQIFYYVANSLDHYRFVANKQTFRYVADKET